MNLFRKLFALYLDEITDDKKIEDNTPLDLGKPLTEEQFSNLSDADQQTFFEKSIDRREEKAKKEDLATDDTEETVDEHVDETEDEKTLREEVEAEATRLEEEEITDETDEEKETRELEEAELQAEESENEDITDPAAKKRLTDTQKAFRTARQENVDLKKRLEELEHKETPEAKAEAAKVAEAAAKPAELTLATIRPEVLQKALTEHPVETMRWIADQQVKQTLEAHKELETKATQAAAKTTRMKESEASTIKMFPVLGEILKMGPEKLADLRETQKVKYLFGKKTARYFKEFAARGDEEAFLNAATRAYVELSPNMIKEIQRETKRLTEEELANKKRVLGKVSISGNKGVIGGKGTPKHKSISDDEFMKLSPAAQMDYWNKSVDSKVAKNSR